MVHAHSDVTAYAMPLTLAVPHLPSEMPGWDVLSLAACAFIAGLARGFSGFGAALIFMPLASRIVGPATAAPMLLIVDAVMSAGMLPGAWRLAERREVWPMAAGAAIGAPVGTILLTWADPLTLRWGIVGTVAVLLITLATGWRFRGQPSAALSTGVGAVSGLFSGAAQVGGPPLVLYLLGRGIPAATLRANIVLFFGLSTLLTGITYLAGGLFSQSVVILAALAGPAYGAGLFLGARLFGMASEATFRRICHALILGAVIVGMPLFDSAPR